MQIRWVSVKGHGDVVPADIQGFAVQRLANVADEL